MPTTELARPTSVLALFCGGTDLRAVVDSMRRRLPGDGLSTARMRPRFDLTRATYRLLDSRILEAAATSLNQDVVPCRVYPYRASAVMVMAFDA